MPTPWLPFFSSPSNNMWGFQVGSRQERLRSWKRVVEIPGWAPPALSLKCLASHKIDRDEIKWVPERDGNNPNTPRRWWHDNLRSRWQWRRQVPGLTMTRKCTHDDDGTTYHPHATTSTSTRWIAYRRRTTPTSTRLNWRTGARETLRLDP